jgi:hypothetical protein
MLLLLRISLLGDGTCEVRVHLSDGYGNRVSAAEIKILGGRSIDVKPDMPFRIDAGSYTFQVRSSGFKMATLPIVIDQLEQVVAVSLQLSALEGPDPTCAVYGHLAGGAISRVRLLELFGSRSIDVPLDAARNFDFRGVACGDYLLVTVGPKSCLGTLMVQARPKTGSLRIMAPNGGEDCKPLTLEK